MNKNKHDHKATKKLKVFLFALFMILPFLIWIPNAFYYGFNAQAQAQTITQNDSYKYSGDYSDTYNINELEVDTLYVMSVTFDNHYDYEYIEFDYLEINALYIAVYTEIDTNTIKKTPFISYTGGMLYADTGYYSYNFDSMQSIAFLIAINENTDLSDISTTATDFSIQGITLPYDIANGSYISITNSITDSMSVAWQQTWSNPLFSWNNSNPLLEPLTNFTNVFGITTDSCIPQALCYLATITMIYVVFDIIIELFTKLTHLINRND